MRNILLIFYIHCIISNISQSVAVAQDFTQLIRQSWAHNDQLKAKSFEIEKADLNFREAKAMYGPTITFGTQYTLASGGRSIDFPVGDLLNPVYSTLNKITAANSFPQIENVNTQFLPNNFYDAKIRISQPIYYPDLAINKQLKLEAVQMEKLELKAFKRIISRDVMIAYFQWETSGRAIEIFKAADTLLMEARRTTQSMIRNGIALPSALARIENQMASVQAQQIEATSNHQNALSYLRFVTGVTGVPDKISLPERHDLSSLIPGQREELEQISQGIKMKSLAINKENKFYTPRLGVQLDGGSQAFDFGFQPYTLLGINLEVNIFDNKRHQYRKDASKADIQASEWQKSYVSDQIDLQSTISKQNLSSAIEQVQTFKIRIGAVDKLYKEVFQKYKEGTSTYLELVDAQTQVTQMKLQYLMAKQNAWMKWAECVYTLAIFPIE